MTGSRRSAIPQEFLSMESVSPIIESATAKDATEIAVFAARAFEHAFAPAFPKDILLEFLQDMFHETNVRRDIADPTHTWLVAKINRRLAGYLTLARPHTGADTSARSAIQLQKIYVDPMRTSCGIGAALLHAGQDCAVDMGYTTMWLGVWTNNMRGIEFYRREGFDIVDTFTFTYKNVDIDHYRMQKKL